MTRNPGQLLCPDCGCIFTADNLTHKPVCPQCGYTRRQADQPRFILVQEQASISVKPDCPEAYQKQFDPTARCSLNDKTCELECGNTCPTYADYLNYLAEHEQEEKHEP